MKDKEGIGKHFKHRKEHERKPRGKGEQGVFKELKEAHCGMEFGVGNTQSHGDTPPGPAPKRQWEA